jgi:hypothetical protein
MAGWLAALALIVPSSPGAVSREQEPGKPVEVQDDLDLEKFYKMFVDLLISQTPGKN